MSDHDPINELTDVVDLFGAGARRAESSPVADDGLPAANLGADVELGRLLDAHRAASVDHNVPQGQTEYGAARKALFQHLNDQVRQAMRQAYEAGRAAGRAAGDGEATNLLKRIARNPENVSHHSLLRDDLRKFIAAELRAQPPKAAP